MIIKIIKQVIAEMKRQAFISRDMRRLVRAELDYAALQRMIDNVSLNNVEIEIKMSDKTVTIKPQIRQEQQFPTFQQSYIKARNQNY